MNVQFDDREAQQNAMYNQLQQSGKKTGLIGMLTRLGMDEKQANLTLIVIAVVAIALTVYFIQATFGTPNQNSNNENSTSQTRFGTPSRQNN